MSPLREPDLVVFDVDGTLHDTFAWWTPVIRRGLARFAALTGIPIAEPDDELAHSVVGMKDDGVWAPFLPPEHRHRWSELREVVVPLEVEEISSGRDYLFPGVRQLLRHLRRVGVHTAIASNCRSRYFAGVCEGQGLRAETDHQFCLDSAGVSTKVDMIRCAVAAAGARRAVMVGDREPDQEAAVAAGVPFVWRVNSRCDLSDAEGVWSGDPDELLALLGLPGIS